MHDRRTRDFEGSAQPPVKTSFAGRLRFAAAALRSCRPMGAGGVAVEDYCTTTLKWASSERCAEPIVARSLTSNLIAWG